MLLHFKKSNEILETWSPHCKNLAFKDPPSLNFHNRTDAKQQHPFASTEIRSHLKTNNNFLHHTLCDNRHHMTRTKCEMEEAGPFQIIPYFMGGAPKLTLFVSTSNRNHGSACCTVLLMQNIRSTQGWGRLGQASCCSYHKLRSAKQSSQMSRRHLVSIHYDSVDSFLDPFLDGFVWICNYF